MQHHLPILLPLLLTLPTLFPPTHALCIQTSCTPSQIPKTCLAAPSSFPKPHRRDDTHPDDKRSVIIASRGNGICYYPSETGRLVTNVVTQMFVLPAGTYALNWAGLYEDRPSDEGRSASVFFSSPVPILLLFSLPPTGHQEKTINKPPPRDPSLQPFSHPHDLLETNFFFFFFFGKTTSLPPHTSH